MMNVTLLIRQPGDQYWPGKITWPTKLSLETGIILVIENLMNHGESGGILWYCSADHTDPFPSFTVSQPLCVGFSISEDHIASESMLVLLVLHGI
jgi:hypothetical protein